MLSTLGATAKIWILFRVFLLEAIVDLIHTILARLSYDSVYISMQEIAIGLMASVEQ